jgi:nitronate monooxygenase
VDDYVKKGGTVADAQGRKCLCNGLLANVGLNQVRSDSEQELALMTAGDDVAQVARFLKPGCDTYTAADVVRCLLDETAPVNGVAQSAAHPSSVPA